MKKTIWIFIFFFFSAIKIIFAQNLVPNPSFEIYDTCVSEIDGFNLPSNHGLKYWLSPNFASPDFISNCLSNPDFGMPQNYGGFQQARTGNCMVDLGNILANINYRENIQTILLHPLEANKKYCFSMYISLMDSCWYATDNFGVCITDTAIYSYSNSLTSFTPQIINPLGSILNDKINWTNISGEYIAHGGEKYITIGIFTDDNNIDTILQPYGSVYWNNINFKVLGYYIDDVSLYLCDDTIIPPNENELTIPNAFTPNNDGINDIFKIKGQNIKTFHGTIINRWGQKLFEWNDVNTGWDGKHDGQDVSAGVYFYIISVVFEDGEMQEKHGSVEVVR